MATEAQLERKRIKIEAGKGMARGVTGEPLVAQANYKVDLMLALNWYNANEESARLTKYGLEYLKTNKLLDFIKYFNAATDHETNRIAIMMRLVTRGQYLADEHKAYIKNTLDELKTKYTIILENKSKKKEADAKSLGVTVTSIDKRVTELARKHMAEIDFEIDKFCDEKANDFSTKTYILQNNLSAAVTKKIAEFYGRYVTELQEAVGGKDEQLNEGYSFFTKAQLKKFQSFIESIVSDCQQQVLAIKANRAPRARKVKPAHIQVAKIQYLEEYPELSLTSIHPTKVVGAQQLWVYNTKNKKLGVYYASGPAGFSVKGTSIQGWDPETSAQNGLRKPAVTIADVMAGSKQQLQKVLEKLTTITTKPNGRINSDTILLRVL